MNEVQTKLKVYEKYRGGAGLSEIDRMDEDEEDQVGELETRLAKAMKDIEELKKENAILSMSNQSELNIQLISMEHKILDLEAERTKLGQKIVMKDERLKELQTQLEAVRDQAEYESEEREQKHDLSKENLKINMLKEKLQMELELVKKKLEKRIKADSENKAERVKLEEEVRKL